MSPECPKLNSILGTGHRRRKTIPLWNNSGKRGLHGITVCLVSISFSIDTAPDLDDYVAEPFSIYAMGESWEYFLVPGEHCLPEAVHCLCTHNTFFKMAPINDSFWK